MLLDSYLPYDNSNEWCYWLINERQNLPQKWPEEGDRRKTEDGDEIELQYRLMAFDPLEQVATRQMRALLWQNGEVIHQEEYTLLEQLYLRNETLDMLAKAGFGEIQDCDGYTEVAAHPDSRILVYIARKNPA